MNIILKSLIGIIPILMGIPLVVNSLIQQNSAQGFSGVMLISAGIILLICIFNENSLKQFINDLIDRD